MKKFMLILLILNSIRLPAQISVAGLPLSHHIPALKNTAQIPVYRLKALDFEKLTKEDCLNETIPLRYAIFEETNIDIKTEGLHNEITSHQGNIWRYKIASVNAKSIQLVFSEFILPSGATLFIYNDSFTRIYGAFTAQNMRDDHTFVIADFNSDHIIVEYFEPWGQNPESKIIIGQIGQAYKDIFKSTADENNFLGINCYEGRNFQNEKHAVCRITFRVGNTGYLCTGTLVNNVKNDEIPYFLTASHCISDSAAAKSMVAYFNYESATCQGSTPLNYNSLSGSSLLTMDTKSDYSLLLLSNTPPSDYKPYYAGWDISDQPDTSSVSIHHANGSTKKISVDYAPPVSNDQAIWWSTTNYSPSDSHWKVQFDAGKTSSGSSGAPLFNHDKRIIGQLHGGDDQIDFYGKLSYSWTRSSSGDETLKSFLDPENTDTTFINGYYPENNLPDAQFFTEFTTACLNAPVVLLNGSAFNTLSWKWTVTPDRITYIQGTDSTSENPVITFDVPGSYTVELAASNIEGSDVITKSGFIAVGDKLLPGILPINKIDSCLCKFDSLTLMANGAAEYSWSLSDETKKNFFLEDTASSVTVIRSIDKELNDTITALSVYLTGYHGNCIDTAKMTYPLLRQDNDDIKDARLIEIGVNGPYSNKCASVEEFEPIPPHYSCTDQLSWCNETGVDIVTNSVWFYFIAPGSGTINISSEGFDNEIAIYKADAYQDILNGKYTIIAANDDRTASDYNPFIKNASVIPDKIYWVQVDGSGGGSEGTFWLELDDKQIVSGKQELRNVNLKLYPQPAGEMITIESSAFLSVNEMLLEVYSLTGTRIYAIRSVKPSQNRLIVRTGEWETGIYIIRIVCDGKILHGKIIK